MTELQKDIYENLPVWNGEVLLKGVVRTRKTDVATYITKNYDIFKRLAGNRLVNQKNVETIVKNIEQNGLLPTVVIVNEKMEIIDGQHRVEAFKRVGAPVIYQIFEGLTLEHCIAMNVSGKKWDLKDYIQSYAEQGSEDYIYLSKKIAAYPLINAGVVASLLGQMSSSSTGGIVIKGLKEGEFRLSDDYTRKAEALHYANQFAEIKVKGSRNTLLVTVGKLYYANIKGIDYGKLVERFRKNLDSEDSINSELDCINLLQNCYNMRLKRKTRFVDAYLNFWDKIKARRMKNEKR